LCLNGLPGPDEGEEAVSAFVATIGAEAEQKAL